MKCRDAFTLVELMPNYPTGYVATEVSAANYIGVFGTVQMLTVCGGTGNYVGDGVLVLQRGFRFADLTDGLSQTFLVGERNSQHFPSTWLGVFAGASHSPGRIVAVASSPPNSDQAAEIQLQQLSPHWDELPRCRRLGQTSLAEAIDRATYLALCTRPGQGHRAASPLMKSLTCRNPESPIAAVNRLRSLR